MKLEKHLVQSKYFLNLLGWKEFKELKEKLKNTKENFDSYRRSFFVDILIGLEGLKLNKDTLLKYYEAI
jgi:hypothetical protein